MDPRVHFRTETGRLSLSMITRTTVLTQTAIQHGLYNTDIVLDLKWFRMTKDQGSLGKSIEIIYSSIYRNMSSLRLVSWFQVRGKSVKPIYLLLLADLPSHLRCA